jgi:hypothetical protein
MNRVTAGCLCGNVRLLDGAKLHSVVNVTESNHGNH